MEDEVVRRRRWLTRERVPRPPRRDQPHPRPELDGDGDPRRLRARGLAGLVAGGACFILPAMLITLALAAAYARYGRLPEAGWILYGVKPVIIAVVVQAMWGLARKALATPLAAAVALAVLVLSLRGADEVVLLFAAALGLPLLRGVATAGGARALAPGGLARPRRSRARPGSPRSPARRRARAPSSRSSPSSSSRSARSSSGAATSSWRSSGRTWSSGPAGSPTRSCWTPSRSASSRPGPSSRPRRSSATSWPAVPGAIVATAGDLPAVLRVRGALEPARPAAPAIALGRRLPRRRERRLGGADGRGHLGAGARRRRGLAHGRARPRGRRRPAGHAAQLRVARRRRRGRRGALAPCSGERRRRRQPREPRPELPPSN